MKGLGYNSVEHFLLHCGSPQIKLAKHKTTGKGATKCGEWVFQEHDYYEGKDEIGHKPPYTIPDKYLLPAIGRLQVPLRIADNTTKFKQFETNETTDYMCDKREKDHECEVVHLPEKPVLNAIQEKLYMMNNML